MDDNIIIVVIAFVFIGLAMLGYKLYKQKQQPAINVPLTPMTPDVMPPAPAPGPAPTEKSVDYFLQDANNSIFIGGKTGQYSIWRPKLEALYQNIGDIFVGDSDFKIASYALAVVVPPDNPNKYSLPPIRYNQIYYDAEANISFWWPVAPSGCKAMGMVANQGTSPPPSGSVRCLRDDYATTSVISNVLKANLYGTATAWGISGTHCFTIGTTKPTYTVYKSNSISI